MSYPFTLRAISKKCDFKCPDFVQLLSGFDIYSPKNWLPNTSPQVPSITTLMLFLPQKCKSSHNNASPMCIIRYGKTNGHSENGKEDTLLQHLRRLGFEEPCRLLPSLRINSKPPSPPHHRTLSPHPGLLEALRRRRSHCRALSVHPCQRPL